MKILSQRKNYNKCRCKRCSTRYTFEPNEILYSLEDINNSQQRYTFYLKCEECAYKIVIHTELYTHSFPNSDFDKPKGCIRKSSEYDYKRAMNREGLS